jgi:hypothetical protein
MKRILFVAAALWGATTIQAGTVYTFTQVSPAGQSIGLFNGAAINTSGLVAYAQNSNTIETWNGSATVSYAVANNQSSSGGPLGLSDAGGISYSYFNGTAFVGEVYSIPLSTVTTFSYPGQSETYATGSSPSGLVAGDSAVSSGGFVWHGGSSFTTITYPGSHGQIYLDGVNNQGDVVGQSNCCDAGVSFIDENGVYTTITVPGETTSDIQAYNLNNYDVVVGAAYNAQGHEDGFIWQNGLGSVLDYPGATDTILYGINSAGKIVGEADFGNNSNAIVFTATLSSATPEPGTLWMLAGGTLLLLAGRLYRIIPTSFRPFSTN